MTIAKRQQRNYIPGIAKLLTMQGYTAVMTYEFVPSGLQNSGQVKWKLHNCQDTTKVVVNLLQLNGERYIYQTKWVTISVQTSPVTRFISRQNHSIQFKSIQIEICEFEKAHVSRIIHVVISNLRISYVLHNFCRQLFFQVAWQRSEKPISILRSLFCINSQQLKRRYEFVIGCIRQLNFSVLCFENLFNPYINSAVIFKKSNPGWKYLFCRFVKIII